MYWKFWSYCIFNCGDDSKIFFSSFLYNCKEYFAEWHLIFRYGLILWQRVFDVIFITFASCIQWRIVENFYLINRSFEYCYLYFLNNYFVSIFNINFVDSAVEHQHVTSWLTIYWRCVRSVIVRIVLSLKFQLSVTVSFSPVPPFLPTSPTSYCPGCSEAMLVLEPSPSVRALWTCKLDCLRQSVLSAELSLSCT